jgi:hypothetical protein
LIVAIFLSPMPLTPLSASVSIAFDSSSSDVMLALFPEQIDRLGPEPLDRQQRDQPRRHARGDTRRRSLALPAGDEFLDDLLARLADPLASQSFPSSMHFFMSRLLSRIDPRDLHGNAMTLKTLSP